jgi:hypothetical protein
MTARLPGILLVPYGVDTWNPADMRIGGQSRAGLEITTPFPCEAINTRAGQPLRFNTASYHFEGMPDMTDSGGDEWTYLKDLLKRLCRPWDRVATLLVDSYFATLENLITDNATTLDAKLAPFAGLFERRHWLFSAPKPLPRAHVFAPGPAGPSSTALSADDFVAVDFAFWTGIEIIVINGQQTNLTPRKARERSERLEDAGIRTLSVTPSDLEGQAGAGFFAAALAPVLPAFWQGEPIPAGPFRSAGFAA